MIALRSYSSLIQDIAALAATILIGAGAVFGLAAMAPV